MMELRVQTTARCVLMNITSLVAGFMQKNNMTGGVYMLFVPHTTAGITINEAADPDVAEDIINGLDSMVPENFPYKHAEGNSPAHIKASLMGSSVLIVMEKGRPVLGTWQGIFFCEFDGPRNRKLQIKAVGDS